MYPSRSPHHDNGDPLAALCQAVHVWHARYMQDNARGALSCTHPPEAAAALDCQQRYMREGTTLLQALSRRADAALSCKHIHDGLSLALVHETATTPEQCLELEEQARVVTFLRAVTQCTQVCLQLCIHNAKRKEEPAQRHAFLDRLCPSIWRIMAALEPRLFWDPRPFWTGTGDPSASMPVWKLYVRLFLLAGIRVQQQLRQQQIELLLAKQQAPAAHSDYPAFPTRAEEEDEEDAEVEDTVSQRRPFRRPADVGFGPDVDDEYDTRDAESWPMSILFGAMHAIADEWIHAAYTAANVRLVARCLLRYATIGFIRTSPEEQQRAARDNTRCVHDVPEYIVHGVGHAAGWIGVDHEMYYGQGGAVLRDILSDLAIVAHTDAWLRGVTYAEPRRVQADIRAAPLAQRLHNILCTSAPPPDESVLMDRCWDSRLLLPDTYRRPAHSMPALQEVAALVLGGIRQFLARDEAVEAEKAFQTSGLVHLIAPGEVWQFTKRWPHMKATPINIINALRPRDMTLYQNHVRTPQAFRVTEQLSDAPPRCLLPMMDHLVWESARHMFRVIGVTKEATEGFPGFLVEPHHLKSLLADDTSAAPFWGRFLVWTRLCRKAGREANRHGFSDAADTWEHVMTRVARDICGTTSAVAGKIPPFPQILLMQGRVLLWNPLAKPLPLDVGVGEKTASESSSSSDEEMTYDDDGDEDEQQQEEEEEREVLRHLDPDGQWLYRSLGPLWLSLQDWTSAVLVDVSTDGAALIWVVWLVSRIACLTWLLRRAPDCQSLACRVCESRVHTYHTLLQELLSAHSDKEEGERGAEKSDGKDKDGPPPIWVKRGS